MSVPLPDVDLRPDHWAIVRDALRRHVPDREVLAFGSRATWTAKDYSDLDLAIMGEEPLSLRAASALNEALVESDLPFRVDIVDWARVDDGFRAIIRRDGVAVQRTAWAQRKLGHVIELKRGYDLPRRQREPGRIPVVSSSGVTGSHRESKVAGPGVVTGRYGTLGKVYFILGDFWPLNTTLYVRDFKGNDARFVHYMLHGLDFSGYSDKAAVPGLNRNHMHEEPVRIPINVAEQRAIAHILGTLDDKIELNRRMNETLEAMARALFKSWFVDFDPVRAKMKGRDTRLPQDIADLFPDRLVDSEMGEIPEGWMVMELGDLCHKPQYGYTASAQSEPVGPRFLRITDINKESWVSWSRVPYCKATDDEFSKYRLGKGDVLIARMADPGHGILVEEDEEAVFASYLIRFRPVETQTARLLQYWLKSDAYWHLVRGRATGTTRRSLNARVLSGFPLVVPPNGVAAAFAGVVGALRERVVASVREMELLAALRDTLLPKLISGEIRVPEADRAVESVT